MSLELAVQPSIQLNLHQLLFEVTKSIWIGVLVVTVRFDGSPSVLGGVDSSRNRMSNTVKYKPMMRFGLSLAMNHPRRVSRCRPYY